jgi:predicted DNA repair protein MutK
MSSGLIALLDDVAGIAKIAATSLDDAAAQAAKAGAKAAGVVIDDAAVTPRYVVGFAAARELPIVWKIALGSLRNKLLYLMPAALGLSLVAPWAITPLLMLGGVYLCFEGFEKVLEIIRPHAHHGAQEGAGAEDAEAARELEDRKVRGAISTDFILSAEIMAITLASVAEASFWVRAGVLVGVGIGITVLVYGAVAIIVKADDAGVALAQSDRPVSAILRRSPDKPRLALDKALAPVTQAIGRALVHLMPVLLSVLSGVGTVAMLWVGGGIIVHGLESYGFATLGHGLHDVAAAAAGVVEFGGAVAWLVTAVGSALFGLVVGAAAMPVATWVVAPLKRAVRPAQAGSVFGRAALLGAPADEGLDGLLAVGGQRGLLVFRQRLPGDLAGAVGRVQGAVLLPGVVVAPVRHQGRVEGRLVAGQRVGRGEEVAARPDIADGAERQRLGVHLLGHEE